MADINLNSFIGPDDDGRTVLLGAVTLPPGVNYASGIKITGGVKNLNVAATSAEGGHDAVVDVNNRATDCVVSVAHAKPKGQFVQTAKGGAVRLHSIFRDIEAHGTVFDFLYNDWSDQQPNLSNEDCELDANMRDGSPVTVAALKQKPIITGGGPYKWPWWQPLNLRIPFTKNYYVVGIIFDTLRRIGFFRSKANNL